jgi:hypothetical protein
MRISFLATIAAAIFVAGVLPHTATAQWTSSRPDGHAPISIMGDHRHEAGEVMLSYRFMYMSMEGSRDGSNALVDTDIVSPTGFNFMVTPTKMPMIMHMFGAMYAPADQVTLMVMLPLLSNEMDHITRPGGAFTTNSSGIGDLRLAGLIGLANFGNQSLHANVTVSFPTGSIDEADIVPPTGNPSPVRLPYPMQLGSGTVDLAPGLTYNGQGGDWSWGGQAIGTFRIGDNSNNWTLGNRYFTTFWGARRLNRNVSLSVRAEGNRTEDIDGADPAPSVNPAVVPTARTDLRSGTRLDAALGLNLYFPQANGFVLPSKQSGLFINTSTVHNWKPIGS